MSTSRGDGLVSGEEASAAFARFLMAPPRRPVWGRWRLREGWVLEYDRGQYAFGLGRLTTSAELCDLIFQLRGKTWMNPIDLFDLLDALDWLLGPQGTLCSSGQERGPIDPIAMLRECGVVPVGHVDDERDPEFDLDQERPR